MIVFMMCLIVIMFIYCVLSILFIKYIVKWSDKYLKKFSNCKYNYDILNQWFKLKQMNIDISSFLLKYNYKTVAIYGMGILGKRLYDELEDSDVNVVRVIDCNANAIYHKGLVASPREGFKDLDVDLIIVTIPIEYRIIKGYMDNNIQMKYLKEIIYLL